MSRTTHPGDGNETELVRLLQALPDVANEDEHLLWRGRFVTADVLVGIGARTCFLPIEAGRLRTVEVRPQKMRSSAFAINAGVEAWKQFWQPMPPPGWNDLFAMNKWGYATIAGDMLLFMQNLQYFKDVFAIPRTLHGNA